MSPKAWAKQLESELHGEQQVLSAAASVAGVRIFSCNSNNNKNTNRSTNIMMSNDKNNDTNNHDNSVFFQGLSRRV